jgi:pimeloyl-ACP methyl ester carboxylesterase
MRPDRRTVDVDGVALQYLRAGTGPLVVLLHGWPQTSHCWRHVIPALAESHTVVAPDLRGYGGSAKPAAGYDKRTMAADLSGLIHGLGFADADVVGHDRGARVAHRWALDHPADIRKLALLDILPSREVLRGMTADSASTLWHWLFHRQPDLPELLVGANVEAYLRHFLLRQSFDPAVFDDATIAEYVRAYSAPDALRASFDEYRAAFDVDPDHDERDAAAGRLVEQPLLVLWGRDGGLGAAPVLETWRRYARDVRGQGLPSCKHYLPEERPEDTSRLLADFLDG